MKNNYQLLVYFLIFSIGYCSGSIFSLDSFLMRAPDVSKPLHLETKTARYMNTDGNNDLSNPAGSKNAQRSQGEPKTAVSQIKISEEQPLGRLDAANILTNELATLRDYRMRSEIDKHSEYLRSIGGNSVEARDNHFNQESVDSAWAKEKETLINNLLVQNEHLSQLPHLASECKSKQCKLSVLSDDQFYLDKLHSSLEKVISDNESSFSSYSTIIDENSHTTSIYFSRD